MRAAHHISRANDLNGLAESLDYIFATTFDAYKEDGQWITKHGRAQVSRKGKFSIEIYSNEHPPPHFHVRGPNINASFSILDFSKMEGCGDLSKKALRLIQMFYEQGGRDKLVEFWNRSRPHNCPVGPIEQAGDAKTDPQA